MPQLPLPPLLDGVPIDAGDIPVGSVEDVENEWSADVMGPEVAPVRDAIIAGQTAMLLQYQAQSRYAAAQSDVLRATGEYLDEIGGERSVFRQPSEVGAAGDVTYRARILTRPSVVDPLDVIAAANAILAPYTAISCRYAERSDGVFLASSTASTWSSHLFQTGPSPQQTSDAPGPHEVPNYPDRLYPDATATGLQSIANRRPPGAMLNEDSYGRWFLLRAPDISLVDTTVAALETAAPADGSGFWLGSGTTTTDQNATYLFSFVSTVDQVYAALVGAVEAIRGHSMRWTLTVDPYLTA